MQSNGKNNLLLIDDDNIRIDPLKDFLKEAGITVYHAHAPGEAWIYLEKEDIDFHLIVLDLIIPTRGAYSREVCPSPEICGEIFLRDLRDPEFNNEKIEENENQRRRKTKKRYKDIPVVVFTARDLDHSDLHERLKKFPYNAEQVDSKKVFDFEKYAQDLRELIINKKNKGR